MSRQSKTLVCITGVPADQVSEIERRAGSMHLSKSAYCRHILQKHLDKGAGADASIAKKAAKKKG